MTSGADLPTLQYDRTDNIQPSPQLLTEQDLPARQVLLTDAGPAVWLVTRYADVRHVLGDRRFHATPPAELAAVLTPMFMRSPGWPGSAAGDDLALLRQLVAPAFTTRRTNALRVDVQRRVDTLLDAMENPADLRQALTFPLPTQVICALLGIPHNRIEELACWSDAVTTPPFRIAPELANTAWTALSDYFSAHLEKKRQQPANDLLSDLAAGAEQLGVADDVLVGLAIAMFIAGHETTVSQLECGFVALFDDHEQLDLLRREPSLAASAVEEILRMYPLNPQGVFRYPTEDAEIGGVRIPAGSPVLAGGSAAAFDPEHFDDPLRFDVTRARNPHLTFGYGPHYCIGAPLARLELETVFGTVFQRFPNLRLAVPAAELRPRMSLAGGFQELPVIW